MVWTTEHKVRPINIIYRIAENHKTRWKSHQQFRHQITIFDTNNHLEFVTSNILRKLLFGNCRTLTSYFHFLLHCRKFYCGISEVILLMPRRLIGTYCPCSDGPKLQLKIQYPVETSPPPATQITLGVKFWNLLHMQSLPD